MGSVVGALLGYAYQRNLEADIAENVGKITEHLGVLSRAVTVDVGMMEEKIKQVVKHEVEESLRPTNVLLNNMAAMLRTLSHSGEDRARIRVNAAPNTS